MKGFLARLRDKGFDLSESIAFTKEYKVRCSQCQALVINGVPTHEHGCPHIVQDLDRYLEDG